MVSPANRARNRMDSQVQADKRYRDKMAMPRPGYAGRWSLRKKSLVVEKYLSGKLSKEQALQDYRLSPDELDTWIVNFMARGRRGLTVKALQELRREEQEASKPQPVSSAASKVVAV